jgi:hypothetical protein
MGQSSGVGYLTAIITIQLYPINALARRRGHTLKVSLSQRGSAMDISLPEELREIIPQLGEASEQSDPMAWVKLSSELSAAPGTLLRFSG